MPRYYNLDNNNNNNNNNNNEYKCTIQLRTTIYHVINL